MSDRETTKADGVAAKRRREPTVGGRYEIRGIIGSGGMGSVYRVYDRELQEVVALKSLHGDRASNPTAVARFRDEVRLARRVTHRNVARTYDIGSVEGVFYLTMEHIEGRSLKDLLVGRGPLGVAASLEIAEDVARGLAAAHAAGVVHRDLKPANIMVEDGGRVVITDFGVAGLAGVGSDRVAGTPAYMAPEQLKGEVVDGRADIYALGVTLFEMLVGHRPFVGRAEDDLVVRRILRPAPGLASVLPSAPASVVRVVDRCLQLDPELRYADVDELSKDLHTARTLVGGGKPSVAIAPVLRVARQTRKTVAVLPLICTSEDAHLATGFADELLRSLAACPDVVLSPRTATSRHEGADPLLAGERLEANIVVGGTVRRADDDLVSLELSALCVANGFELWTGSFVKSTMELFWLSYEVAQEIAAALSADLESDPGARTLTDPGTIDLYLRARHALWSNWTSSKLLSSEVRDLWELLIVQGPDNPRTLAGAATYYARAATFASSGEFAARARELAADAVARDPTNPDGHWANASVAWTERRLADALSHARRALEISPTSYESTTLVGKILLETGPLEDAVDMLQRAYDLDVEAFHIRWDLARGRAYQGRWADVDYLMALEVDQPNMAFLRGIHRGRLDLWRRAPVWLDVPIDMQESDPDILFFVPAMQFVLRTGKVHPAFASAADGYAASKPRLAALAYQVGCEMALKAGDRAEAFSMLKKAVDAGLRDVVWLTECPLMQPILDTPEHRAAVRAVKELQLV